MSSPSSTSTSTSVNSPFSSGDLSLVELTQWFESIPAFAKKPMKNVNRDFSDGVLMAELLSHHFPKMVELHNYVPTSRVSQKMANWELLNRKILPKLGIKLPAESLLGICHAKSGYIEPILRQIRKLIAKKSEEDEEEKRRRLGAGDVTQDDLQEAPCLIHILPGVEIPSYVIHEGVRFVPEESLHAAEAAGSELKVKIKELTSKVQRLETLINLKESHLGDLTREVHELREKLWSDVKGGGDGGDQWESKNNAVDDHRSKYYY